MGRCEPARDSEDALVALPSCSCRSAAVAAAVAVVEEAADDVVEEDISLSWFAIACAFGRFPRSGSVSLVTARKKPAVGIMAVTRQGSRNGYSPHSEPGGKTAGYLSAGWQSRPPMAGPRMPPAPQQSAMKPKACASFVSSVMRPMYVFVTPITPLKSPPMKRTVSAHSREWERPNSTVVMAVKVIPISITGFRPTTSDMRPQKNEEKNWPTINEEAIHPE